MVVFAKMPINKGVLRKTTNNQQPTKNKKMEYKYKFDGEYLTCPSCGRIRKYRDFYVSKTGKPVAHMICGECFSASCGYRVTPSQYFSEHPEARSQTFTGDWQPHPEPPVTYIDRHHVADYIPAAADLHKSNLLAYLLPIFGADKMMPVVRKYGVGVDADGSTRWPQIDERKRVRQIKVQQHNRFNGHREGITDMTHKHLRDIGEIDPESQAEQCLFGQHLLANANEETIAAVVESEKTAFMFAMLYPQVVWVATGGEGNFSLVRKAQNLLGRCGSVTIIPDAGSFAKWKQEARKLSLTNIEFSNICSGHSHNVDIADLLIYEYLSTHRQPQQQELDFSKPAPSATPTAAPCPSPSPSTTAGASTPTTPAVEPRIRYSTILPFPSGDVFSSLSQVEFDSLLSPEAVAAWQTAHPTAPF